MQQGKLVGQHKYRNFFVFQYFQDSLNFFRIVSLRVKIKVGNLISHVYNAVQQDSASQTVCNINNVFMAQVFNLVIRRYPADGALFVF